MRAIRRPSITWSRRRWLALGVVSLLAVAVIEFGSSPPAATARATAAASKCGVDVPVSPTSAAFKSLPPAVQKEYTYFPYPVTSTPWSTFKGKKPPWKIGYISEPLFGSGGWLVHILAEVKALAKQYEKMGLVSSLVTYVPPDPATATPAEQIAAIQKMVREGVDAIMLEPLSTNTLNPAIDAAGKAGIPVISVDNPLIGSKYGVFTYTDNNSPTYPQVLKLIGGKGNVLIARGVLGSGAEAFWYGQAKAAAARCPGIKVVGTINGNWDNATVETGILSFLAAHPGVTINGVLEMGGMAPGIFGAFLQHGTTVPAVNIEPCPTGVFSNWLAHKSTAKYIGACFDGYQTAWTNWGIMLRILAGKGPKVNGISIGLVGKLITSANLSVYAKPGLDINAQDEPRGPINGYGSDKFLDQYFAKPGSPGRADTASNWKWG